MTTNSQAIDDGNALLAVGAETWNAIQTDPNTSSLPRTVQLRLYSALMEAVAREYMQDRATYLQPKPVERPPGEAGIL